MGYIQHEVACVVFFDTDSAGLAELLKWRDALDEDFRRYVLGPVTGVNGYTTVVFAPDGSKEGWAHSDTAETLRREFLRFADAPHSDRYSFKSGDAVLVRFGGDYGEEFPATVVSANGAAGPKVEAKDPGAAL